MHPGNSDPVTFQFFTQINPVTLICQQTTNSNIMDQASLLEIRGGMQTHKHIAQIDEKDG